MEQGFNISSEHGISIEAIRALSVQAGLGKQFDLEALPGGGNNRVYRLETAHRALLLKVYFHHADDTRDRLRREFQFLQYLWSNGVRSVPEPIAADYERHLGLYEFIHGERLLSHEIELPHIDEAIAFYRSVNAAKDSPRAQLLSPASEACFSIAEHLRSIEKRLERLRNIEIAGDVDEEAHEFVVGRLGPFWRLVSAKVTLEYGQRGLLHASVPRASRCLSPSDFGFHNALVEESGAIRFLDFEYAGWDDPAKLACDFANQPDMLLPEELCLRFREAVIELDPSPGILRRRILFLVPVYQIKWSCIVLNVFLSLGRDRMVFTQADACLFDRKKEQLLKARRMLERGKASYEEVSSF